MGVKPLFLHFIRSARQVLNPMVDIFLRHLNSVWYGLPANRLKSSSTLKILSILNCAFYFLYVHCTFYKIHTCANCWNVKQHTFIPQSAIFFYVWVTEPSLRGFRKGNIKSNGQFIEIRPLGFGNLTTALGYCFTGLSCGISKILSLKKQDFWQISNIIKGNHCILWIQWASVCQKLALC